MGNLNPTIGRIVHYTITDAQAQVINARRTTSSDIAEKILDEKWPIGAQAHIGNMAHGGATYPAIILVVHEDTEGPTGLPLINAKVLLDGTDEIWVTDVAEDHQPAVPGTWCWPARS